MWRLPLLLTLTATPAAGQGGQAMQAGNTPLARASLLADEAYFTPGKTLWMAVAFDIPQGWHLYWNGLNDSGLEPTVEFTLPKGFVVGDLQWPAPERKVTANMLVDHVYEHRLVLPFPVAVPANSTLRTLKEIKVKVDWLICKEACIPESAILTRRLPVAKDEKQSRLRVETPIPWTESEHKAIAAARASIPRRPPKGLVQGGWTGNTLRLEVSKADHLEFFPDRETAKPLQLLQQGATDGTVLQLDFEPTTVDRGARGLLCVETAGGTTCYHIER